MAKILARALVALDKFYDFDATKRFIQEFDLTSPIQAVHDVSREVELASAPGTLFGFSSLTFVNTHAVAAGAIRSNLDPYDPAILATLQVQESDVWAFLMNFSARVEAGLTVTIGTFAIEQAAITGSITSHTILTHEYDSQTGIAVNDAADLTALIKTDSPAQNIPFPMLVTPGATLTFSTFASGAIAACRGQATMYFCPRGSYPPGIY